jgi:hypothetical protein
MELKQLKQTMKLHDIVFFGANPDRIPWLVEEITGLARENLPNICQWAWVYPIRGYCTLHTVRKDQRHLAGKHWFSVY